MSDQYDVIVIGGGIAGLATAANITDGKVLLLEKDRIRTQEGRYLRFIYLNSIDRFGLSNCILTKYNVLSLRSTTGSKFDFHFDDHEMLLLDLGKIHSTLKKHIEKNHEIREKIQIRDVKQNNQKIEVEISRNNDVTRIYTKYLVDASGNQFFTRKKFHLECPDLLSACLSAPFKGGYIGDLKTITFIIPTSQFKSGGWLYPFNNRDYTLGIAQTVDNTDTSPIFLKGILTQLQNHPIFEDVLQEGNRQEWDVGIIPVGISYPLVFSRICYVGDVVGQANPWDMNGIRPTLECSIICADAINLALKQDDKSLLENYHNNWNSTYGPEYNNYDHWGKWTKTTEAWESTSMKHMLDDLKHGQDHLLNRLRYYNMSESRYNYLKNLRSHYC